MDILTDVLTTLRLRGTVYFQADFGAPWGMEIEAGAVSNFHLVVEGSCWLRGQDNGDIRKLNQGDLVVLAHGTRHSLLHAPEAESAPAQTVVGDGKRRSQSPEYGGEGDVTRLICGHYEYDRAGRHPLLRALPKLIHLSGEQRQNELMTTTCQLVVKESRSLQGGSGAIVDRLAEVLFIEVIRQHAQQSADQQGFLAALAEPTLATALAALHGEPERPWKLDELSRKCGVSRTKLGDCFKESLGIPPMQYLTEWRMHKARELLTNEKSSVAQVAAQVGYSSEFSFSKAYKRVFGETPGMARAA